MASSPRLAAVVSVVLGLVAAVLTNLVTDRWTWTAGIALAAVSLVWSAIEAWRTPALAGATATVRQRVKRVSGQLVGVRRRSGAVQVEQKIRRVDKGAEVVGLEGERE